MKKCLITSGTATAWTETEESLQYSISFNKHSYTLLFQRGTDWERFLTNERKLILKSWLWNAEWPVAGETLLTETLLERAIRQIPNPGEDFYKKLDYFLLHYYRNGGRELNPYAFSPIKHLAAFTENINEFQRLIEAGKQRGWIEQYEEQRKSKKGNVSFYIRLTNEGLQYCEQLFQRNGLHMLEKKFRPLRDVKVFVVNASEDQVWAKNVSRILGDRGASVVQHGEGITSDDAVYLHNAKQTIKDCDFVILIKSAASDQLRLWADMLAATSEEEERVPVKNPFFFALATDDSSFEAYSYLSFKDDRLWDFRILPHQNRLFLYMMDALNKRPKDRIQEHLPAQPENVLRLMPENFSWPVIKMTRAQRYWLGLLCSKFIKGEYVDLEKEEPLHWGKFGKEEKPTALDYVLISGSEPRLLGIWLINKKSNLFQLFEDTVHGITTIFQTNGFQSKISTEDLRVINRGVSDSEIYCVGRLLCHHGFFSGQSSSEKEGEFTYHISGNQKEKFRLFPGIENLVINEINTRTDLEFENLEEGEYEWERGHDAEIFRSGTPIELADRPSKIVLGVHDLAADVFEIIDRLPEQIGRMIGIFGPWGRGKSVLIDEISGLLSKADEKRTPVSLWHKILQMVRLKKNEDRSHEKEYLLISFHAWKYQDTPAAWAYLYECFADTFFKKPKASWKFWGWVKYAARIFWLNAHRTRLIPLLKIAGITMTTSLIIWFLSTSNLKLEEQVPLLKLVGGTAIVTLGIALFDRVYKVYRTRASDLIGRFTSRPNFKNEMGIQAEIQKELQVLLSVWSGKQRKNHPQRKIVLIVEDIDRCSEDKIIQIIDGLRVMLENPDVARDVIIICAVDERVLTRAVRAKYADLMAKSEQRPGETGNTAPVFDAFFYPQYPAGINRVKREYPNDLQKLTSEYLDKLFILAIKLGKLTQEQRLELIDVFIGEVTDYRSIEETPPEPTPEGISASIANAEIQQNATESSDINEDEGQTGGGANTDQTQNNVPEPGTIKQKNQIKFEPFTSIEKGLVRDVIGSWEGATPRQIRIFYYRYLLAKNLLIKRYSFLVRENVWLTYPLAEYLPLSIMQYMNTHRPEEIYEKRAELLERDAVDTVNLTDVYASEVQVKDYIELLSVLEIVVAY